MPEINEQVQLMLKDLLRFQDRQFQLDPLNAKRKKRMVMGLREVLKGVNVGRIKVVLMVPNVEECSSEGATFCAFAFVCCPDLHGSLAMRGRASGPALPVRLHAPCHSCK
jgi:hypothetical protein